jgi:type VI secretion system secreted protein VgrG
MGKMATIELRHKDDKPALLQRVCFFFPVCEERRQVFVLQDGIASWLFLLRYRYDNRIFHNLTLREQTDKAFERYLERDWRLAGASDNQVMTDAFQYGESDYNYCPR